MARRWLSTRRQAMSSSPARNICPRHRTQKGSRDVRRAVRWCPDRSPSWKSAGKESHTMKRATIMACLAASAMMVLSPSIVDAASQPNGIPDLSAGGAAWRNTHNDFILPSSGPGPVTWDPAHPFVGNGGGGVVTLRVADLSNPILMPWVRDVLKKFNDDALAGKEQRSPTSLCRPNGVPGMILLRNEPL